MIVLFLLTILVVLFDSLGRGIWNFTGLWPHLSLILVLVLALTQKKPLFVIPFEAGLLWDIFNGNYWGERALVFLLVYTFIFFLARYIFNFRLWGSLLVLILLTIFPKGFSLSTAIWGQGKIKIIILNIGINIIIFFLILFLTRIILRIEGNRYSVSVSNSKTRN